MAIDQPSHAIVLRQQGLATLRQYELSQLSDVSRLRQAVTYLYAAFEAGDYVPETVWSLTRALRFVSDLQGIIQVLKCYAEHAPSREQEFLARHYIVDHYALLRQHEAAVTWHRDLLTRMQGVVPPDRLLWSFSDTTMLRSWKAVDCLSEWTMSVNDLYRQVPDTVATCEARAAYLRTLIEAVHLPAGAYIQALEVCDQLMVFLDHYRDQWVAARWLTSEVFGVRLSIYHAMDASDLEIGVIMDGRQYLGEYAEWLKLPTMLKENNGTSSQGHTQLYHTALHNFGCQCLWTGHYQEAVDLLEQALLNWDVPETHFFLAGAILQATNDQGQSLKHFCQAVEHSDFSRRHELKQAFLEESSFGAVHDDSAFLAVIEKENQKLTQLNHLREKHHERG